MFSRGALTLALLVGLFYFQTTDVGAQNIKLINNGYEGILVAISECVSEDQHPYLIEDIQRLFSKFSDSLFFATDSRAYVRNVTILVPGSWNSNGYRLATGESFLNANFRVDEKHPLFGNRPHAVEDPPEHQCEHEWDHIHLTPEYVTNFKADTDHPAMELVHEWGHFRWALGDEHPAGNDQQWQLHHQDMTGPHLATRDGYAVVPNRCSQQLPFHDPDCYYSDIVDERWEECAFKPNMDMDFPFPVDNFASVMFDIYSHDVPKLNKFCGLNPDHIPENPFESMMRDHNPHALNDHQRRCGTQSSWDVMIKHDDFNNANRKQPSGTDIQPSFQIIQQRHDQHRIVLVLDVSGSMGSDTQRGTLLERMNVDAAEYIVGVPNGTFMGIVAFDSNSRLLHEIDVLPENEGSLLNALPPSPLSGTCITCGLQGGLNELRRHNSDTSGGRILLITDGEHNQGNPVETIIPDLVDAEIIVDSIQYTAGADPILSYVSYRTGGLAFFDPADDDSTEMVRALLSQLQYSHEPCSSALTVPVLTEAPSIAALGDVELHTTIDGSLGHNTRFSFTHRPTVANPLSVVLTDPIGQEYLSSDASITDHSQFLGILSMTIPGQAEFGEWTMKVSNTHNSQFSSQVVVTSTPLAPSEHSLTAAASITGTNIDLESEEVGERMVNLYCTVRKGLAPILSSSVIARVESDYEVTTITLLDNGHGVDVVAHDGVYSALFVRFTTNGRYTVSVEVSDSEQEIPAIIVGSTTPERQQISALAKSSVGSFERVASAGLFTVAGHPGPPGFVPNVLPPARVNDFQFVGASLENQTVELRWTAVGSDLFIGTAHRYEVRYSSDIDEILNSFDNCSVVLQHNILKGSLLGPLPSGVRETFVIKFTKDQLNGTQNYGLRVYDDGGLFSDVSNVAQVFVPLLVPMGVDGDSNTAAIIIGSVCAVMLTGIMIAVIVLLVHLHKKQRVSPDPGLHSTESERKAAGPTPEEDQPHGPQGDEKQAWDT